MSKQLPLWSMMALLLTAVPSDGSTRNAVPTDMKEGKATLIEYVWDGQRFTGAPLETDTHRIFSCAIYCWADDPEWEVVNVATGHPAHVQWLHFRGLDNSKWSARIKCGFSRPSGDPNHPYLECHFVDHNDVTGKEYEAPDMGFLDWSGAKWKALLPSAMGDPQGKVRPPLNLSRTQ